MRVSSVTAWYVSGAISCIVTAPCAGCERSILSLPVVRANQVIRLGGVKVLWNMEHLFHDNWGNLMCWWIRSKVPLLYFTNICFKGNELPFFFLYLNTHLMFTETGSVVFMASRGNMEQLGFGILGEVHTNTCSTVMRMSGACKQQFFTDSSNKTWQRRRPQADGSSNLYVYKKMNVIKKEALLPFVLLFLLFPVIGYGYWINASDY